MTFPTVRFRLPKATRTLSLLLATALFASACDDDGTTDPPTTVVPLPAGTWYMHTANGNALPAEISRRFVGLVDEQTMLDSSRLVVRADGTWEQRYHLRVLHTGVLDRDEVVLDEGTWIEVGVLNEFTSTVRLRTFDVGVAHATMFASDEPMVFFANAPTVLGVYRTTAPTP